LSIAEQCPLDGGRIVYEARSLYTLIDSEKTYEDACAGIQALGAQQETTEPDRRAYATAVEGKIASIGFSVQPNPVSDQLVISGQMPTVGNLLIYHTSGKLLRNYPLAEGKQNQTIRVADLPDGLYVVTWMQADGLPLHSAKIIIQH